MNRLLSKYDDMAVGKVKSVVSKQVRETANKGKFPRRLFGFWLFPCVLDNITEMTLLLH